LFGHLTVDVWQLAVDGTLKPLKLSLTATDAKFQTQRFLMFEQNLQLIVFRALEKDKNVAPRLSCCNGF